MKQEFFRKKLKNGVTVLFEKRKQNVVSVSASVKEGSAFESEDKKGISHFIEHLMFKGTKTRNYKEIAKEIEKKGGVLNAYTGEDITCYWNKLPSKHLTTGLDIVSDLILNPKFDPAELEKERFVILEEIKMYHDTPSLYVQDKIKSLLFKKPFGLSGLGTPKNICKFSREDIARYFKKKYTSNKMILCVVGNADIEEIIRFGEKFPKTKSKEERVRVKKINKQTIEKRKGLDQAHITLGFHFNEKERYANEIFNTILAKGMASRLFEELREKRGLAYSVQGFLELGKGYGYQVIYAGTTKKNVRLCKEIILKEIKKLQKLEKRDFEECKEQLIGLRKVGSEESVNVMNALIQEEVCGNALEFYKYDEKIKKVKLKDVRKLSKIKGFSSFVLVPE